VFCHSLRKAEIKRGLELVEVISQIVLSSIPAVSGTVQSTF